MKRLAVIIFFAASARAHDFWIEPSTYRPAAGDTVTASLRVGENFDGEPVPRSSRLLDSFVARDARRLWDIPGFENSDPAGILRIEGGLTVIGYRSKPYPHTITAEKFRQFLREEGVDLEVSGDGMLLEQFTRYAKTLLGSGDGAGLLLGFRYEIMRKGDSFRVMQEGKPMPNALVVALHRDGTRLSARTDAEGWVKLRLTKRGVWLVKSVQVVRAAAGSGADWESLWASLTFER